MTINENLSIELQYFTDKIENTLNEIFSNEKKISRMKEDHEWCIACADKTSSKFMVFFLYLAVVLISISLFGHSWWAKSLWALGILVIFEALIFNPVYISRINTKIESYQQDMVYFEREIEDLYQKLLPEIYPLGMMTSQNIKDKTSAKYMPIMYIDKLMEREVELGNVEKIKLNKNFLYKTKNFKSSKNTITLNVD